MPTYPHIQRYREELAGLIEAGGSDSELSIRPAFQNCLASYCAAHKEKLTLVPELSVGSVRPDGTVKDTLRMTRGYWEAKDTRDDLDREIQRKFDSGYPRDNIVFEDSRTAVLVQNREEAMRVDMNQPGALHRLIRRFLDYELPQIEEFRGAQAQFKADLPTVIANLREAVEAAEAENADYQSAAAGFLELCRRSIGPDVSAADVREMLLQHVLTKDVFLRVFAEDQFHRENNVARQLDELERSFFTGDVRRQAIDRLRAYYGAIGRAADEIADYAEKQGFLKAVYEDFYKAYNPAAADRLGVVYTPNEVVDFIIRGADHLLRKHFGRTLADDNVQILDPATGTGTFITSLIDYLPADRLEYKYLNEIHANEVAILPYYIANLNIEYAYKEKTGRYVEFPNLVFVDTLDNTDWQNTGAASGSVTRQGAFNLGGLSTENWMRVQLQNEKPISVIIGNPPYNAAQNSWNEFNPNRQYPQVDNRIRETYVASSAVHKTKQYDMYKRFIRWASDRLNDDGIIGFITNRAYLDARQDDGFRKMASTEFSDIYIVDLGSDVRRNPGISGTSHNVFGIQTGVAISLFVRDKTRSGECRIHYAQREDTELASDKLAYLDRANFDEVFFESIVPDANHNWLKQSSSNFNSLMPLARQKLRSSPQTYGGSTLFSLYSMGVVTNRDGWVYDFDAAHLGKKTRAFINSYEESRSKFAGAEFEDAALGREIKWTPDLIRQLRSNIPVTFNRTDIRKAMYRPFVSKYLYFNKSLNWSQYRLPEVFPNSTENENAVISFCMNNKQFYVLAAGRTFDLHFAGDGWGLPLYRYTPDGERVSNITDWALRHINDYYRKGWGKQFEELAGGDSITAEDIFAYTYAILHDPDYRHEYRFDLLREFPRIPLFRDFHEWVIMGRELLDLHIGFESAEPFPLERRDVPLPKDKPPKPILRADKQKGLIFLDEQTTLAGVPQDAWRYVLGSRSALEWVLDQYKEKKPRDPTIREKFNTYRFSDHKERVIDLLRRVCTVSDKTMEIVDSMAYWYDDILVVSGGDRQTFEPKKIGWENLVFADDDEDAEWLAEWLAMPDIYEQES